MVEIKKLKEMSPEELEKVQSVLDTFNLLGITDEQIALLPQVLALWPTIVNNMNLMAQDLATLKLATGKKEKQSESLDTEEAIRKSVGFDNHTEMVFFDEEGDKK